MQRHILRICAIGVLATMLASAPARAQGAPPSAAGVADYQARLAHYSQIRRAYDEEASAYWDAVVEKRRARNAKRRHNEPVGLGDYVLTQPPVYSGPPRPIDPRAPTAPPPEEKPPIPVIADFLKMAAEQFGFAPQRPHSELEFKKVYAQVAAAAGLSRDQIVGVYAFETGGNGTYDMPTQPCT